MAALSTIAALGLSAASSAFSFIEAGKQRKMEREAYRDAERAIAEAKKKLEINYMKGLSIAKEPYELEREALLSQGALALQAGVEGDPRGAAATAGRAMQVQQLGQRQQRADMAGEMQRLGELAADEESRLQTARVNVDIGEAIGQQQRGADSRRAAAQATQAGVQGLAKMGTSWIESRDLYADERTDAEKADIKANRQLKRLRKTPEYKRQQQRMENMQRLQQGVQPLDEWGGIDLTTQLLESVNYTPLFDRRIN